MSNETEEGLLDRNNVPAHVLYSFIDTPVWFTSKVHLPKGTVARVRRLASNFNTVQAWLDSIHEAVRAGIDTPEMTDEIKEILWPESAGQKSAKPPKKRATEAASSTESPSS